MSKLNVRQFVGKNKATLTMGGSFAVVAAAYLSFPDKMLDFEVDGSVDVNSVPLVETVSDTDDRYIQDRRYKFQCAVSDTLKGIIRVKQRQEELKKSNNAGNKALLERCDAEAQKCHQKVEEYQCTSDPQDENQKIQGCISAVQENDEVIHCCFGMIDAIESCYRGEFICLGGEDKKTPDRDPNGSK